MILPLHSNGESTPGVWCAVMGPQVQERCWNPGESVRATEMLKGQAYLVPLLTGKAEGEKGRLRCEFSQYLKGGWKEEGARLFSVAYSDRTRDERQELKRAKFQSEHQETLMYCTGD